MKIAGDITGNKKEIPTLETSGKINSLILKGTKDLIIHISKDRDLIWSNKNTEDKPAGVSEEGKCYFILHGYDQICSGCPVEESSETNNIASIIVNDEGDPNCSYAEIDAIPLMKGEYSGDFLIRYRDISDRINSEIELKSREENTLRLNKELAEKMGELQEVNSELESLTYSVSHDLRAPLRSIDGFSLALLEDYGETLDENGLHYLKRIRASAQRMGELIDDLLSLSRLSCQEMNPADIDLSEICRIIAADLQKNSPERRSIINIEDGMVIRGDLHLMKTVMENIIENAWKFTSYKETAEITVGSDIIDNEKIISIKDNGAGFNMEYSDKMFSVFQRLHSDREFPGTGIGLATVHKILSRHGGRIWAEGEKNSGAAFYFTARGLPE